MRRGSHHSPTSSDIYGATRATGGLLHSKVSVLDAASQRNTVHIPVAAAASAASCSLRSNCCAPCAGPCCFSAAVSLQPSSAAWQAGKEKRKSTFFAQTSTPPKHCNANGDKGTAACMHSCGSIWHHTRVRRVCGHPPKRSHAISLDTAISDDLGGAQQSSRCA